MTPAGILLVSVLAAAQPPVQPLNQPLNRSAAVSACAQVSADALTDVAVGEICAGDAAARAPVTPFDADARARSWRAAADHYRRAATLASKAATKAVALNALANLYDATQLNDVNQLEATLRELIALKPDDLAPMYRLARAQEDHGMVDAAENTLLQARHQQPDAAEPYAAMAAFYSRQAAARRQPSESGAQAGHDEKRVYRVGGDIVPPQKLIDVRPQYPPEALAAGTAGVVILETTIDEVGSVTGARILRSIPVFDQAAIDAVRQWRFMPTMVNGQAVPVQMTVTVNFSQQPSNAPPPRPLR